MTKFFLVLGLLGSFSAAAQELPTPSSPTPAPDTLGTLLLNGQRQPARPFLTVQDQLRTVAGVQVTPYDGAPGSGQVVRVRGASAAQGLSQPLYVVDGLPALNDDLTPGQTLGLLPASSPQASSYNSQLTTAEQNKELGASPLQLLPPESIASIEVLSGPAAVARYGPLAANGVISIRTRQGAGAGRPLRLHYAGYAGVQQLRQRYDLLDASQYADLANEASYIRNGSSVASPFPNLALGRGTDWQAETYRLAALQQHQLTLSGGRGGTTYLVGADYRQQAGILRGAELTRLGLRLGLGQQLGTRVQLRGTLALGQTTQRLPHTQSGLSATRAALLAPPVQGPYTATGSYNGYDGTYYGYGPGLNFSNPLALADYAYRDPSTRRLLAQLGGSYQPLPGLVLEASANFQRTLLGADSYQPRYAYQSTGQSFGPPIGSFNYNTQTYRASAWAGQLALRYQRALGTRHQVGAELSYQYQGLDYASETDTRYQTPPGTFGGYAYYRLRAETRLPRPWARLHYTLDSTLTLEASLSYSRYRGLDAPQYYPSAQLSWRTPATARLAARAWAGVARTSTFGQGGTAFLNVQAGAIFQPGGTSYLQPAFYVNQAEAGLRLASRSGHLTGQLVAYQRQSHHSLFAQAFGLPGSTGWQTYATFDEASIRNQGLELTLTADWQRGRLQGSTRFVGSLNRNRLHTDAPYAATNAAPIVSDAPTGTFYGAQQNGLTPTGQLQFTTTLPTQVYQPMVLGGGIPPQLASLSQQLRLGRLAFDVQLDGLFGYQLVNYQLSYLDTPTGTSNSATTALDRWTPTNPNTSIPVAGAPANVLGQGGVSPQASYLVEDAAHLRLSSLTLSYRLRHTATQDLSVWVGGQNLFVLTSYRGYDPNVSSGGATASAAGLDYGATPVPRTWLLGVSFSI